MSGNPLEAAEGLRLIHKIFLLPQSFPFLWLPGTSQLEEKSQIRGVSSGFSGTPQKAGFWDLGKKEPMENWGWGGSEERQKFHLKNRIGITKVIK